MDWPDKTTLTNQHFGLNSLIWAKSEWIDCDIFNSIDNVTNSTHLGRQKRSASLKLARSKLTRTTWSVSADTGEPSPWRHQWSRRCHLRWVGSTSHSACMDFMRLLVSQLMSSFSRACWRVAGLNWTSPSP